MVKRKYTDNELLDYLIIFYKEQGRVPKSRDFGKGLPGRLTYSNRFGSWNKALQKAGLNIISVRKIGKKVTDEYIINSVREKYNKTGKSPDAKDFSSMYAQRFGTWNNLLRKAGIPLSRRQDYSNNELLDILKQVSEKLGRTPKVNEFDKLDESYPKSILYHRRFGSWNNAIKKAGLDITKEMKYTKKMIISSLHDFKKLHSRVPKALDFSTGKPEYVIVKRILQVNTWHEVLEKAGFKKSEWANKNSLPFKWERFVQEAVKELYPDAIVKKKFVIDDKLLIPDNYIPSLDLIIDAKLSDYHIKNRSDKQCEQYLKITENISFWCLQKNKKQQKLPVKYVYAKEIHDILLKNGCDLLAKRCMSFIKMEDDELRKEIGLWTKKDLIAELYRFKKEFSKLPSATTLDKAKGYPSANTYTRIFGFSLAKLKKKLGHSESKYVKKYCDKQEIRDLIIRFCSKHGRKPYVKEFKREYGLPSTNTIIRKFGSLSECWKYCKLD
ncbi:hypothetical protein HN587_07015 [Candidatus Woesearchaeota archaeon]|jgi:hypothetical protein|nr:hypothetical protein [Candidatus Woesearchaeota archaeon]